jgi:erythromycin esterase
MRRSVATLVIAALLTSSVLGQGHSAWIAWARDHHRPIASLTSPAGDDFADLAFLNDVLGTRRLVQLGESGHGVAEFNQVKVRLIKFLHERMGFDVIAFESGVFECFAANAHPGSAAQMLAASIFGVWATEEVRELFDYIKATQATERPLVLAGFDSQNSSTNNGAQQRPAFFRRVIATIDPTYADSVAASDAEMLGRFSQGPQGVKAHEAGMLEFYEGLAGYLEENLARLMEAAPGDPSPKIAYRSAWSMVRFVRQIVASVDRPSEVTGIRDPAMADNLTYLAREVYPDKKILVWAHNFHIRHDNASTVSGVATMGTWIKERFRDELYTIGLYMDRGTAAQNNRTVYSIAPASVNSMEWVLASVGPSALFIDFLHATRTDGNAWIFERTLQREWGTNPFEMVPRDQYDGVILIDVVSSPSYL